MNPSTDPPFPEFYFVIHARAMLICERTTETEGERAQSLALTIERVDWNGPVVFLECRHCPWRPLCPVA